MPASMRRRWMFAASCALAPLGGLSAQVRVNPTGVSVSSMSATTVYLTYGGLNNQRPREAYWCGELVPAVAGVGSRCDPATIYGQVPARYDLAVWSSGVYTDIMSVPASVARTAYQAAVRGATSTFFFVRRFESTSGGPDQWVAVTCRLTGGGARVPFSLTDVRLQFGGDDALPFITAGEAPPSISARITYTGTGRLIGRWEVVLPGEEPPDAHDLLTEASLPPDERGSQRQFTQLERFDVFLPPDGHVVLPGPDPKRLPSMVDGTYRVLLRIEASDERENDSDLGAAGAGAGIVHSGAVAGFPLPVLRYVVAGTGARTAIGAIGEQGEGDVGGLRLIDPAERDSAAASTAVSVRWMPTSAAGSTFYRVDFETDDGSPVWSAILPSTARRYEAPAWIVSRAAGRPIRWRVTGLAADGSRSSASAWRLLRAR